MDLLIFSLGDAINFQPVKQTYAIRIYSSGYSEWMSSLKLKDSSIYAKIKEYVFDDNDNFFKGGPLTIDEAIARTIINDFKEEEENIEALLVHCTKGQNRSPAVAMALNDIFTLGHDTRELRRKYPFANGYVYCMLVETAKKMSL